MRVGVPATAMPRTPAAVDGKPAGATGKQEPKERAVALGAVAGRARADDVDPRVRGAADAPDEPGARLDVVHRAAGPAAVRARVLARESQPGVVVALPVEPERAPGGHPGAEWRSGVVAKEGGEQEHAMGVR
jgi:hypothetical protein